MMNLANIPIDQAARAAILVIALAAVFIFVRYFFHIIVHLLHFVTSFFWQGCLVLVILAIVLGVLHFYLHVI